MKTRLNIFIDETGEFGFKKGSAKLYGVSLVFHEQDCNITKEIKTLEHRFNDLDFHSMVHMGDLVTGHGDFTGMTIAKRRKIYECLYRFATQIDAKYHTIIINKQNAKDNNVLARQIKFELRTLIIKNLKYFQNFNQIKIYYDEGQAPLNGAINNAFSILNNCKQESNFNHLEKKLFQIADMLTYLDKIIYKYNKNIKLTKTEQIFFTSKQAKTAINELLSHRIKKGF